MASRQPLFSIHNNMKMNLGDFKVINNTFGNPSQGTNEMSALMVHLRKGGNFSHLPNSDFFMRNMMKIIPSFFTTSASASCLSSRNLISSQNYSSMTCFWQNKSSFSDILHIEFPLNTLLHFKIYKSLATAYQ